MSSGLLAAVRLLFLDSTTAALSSHLAWTPAAWPPRLPGCPHLRLRLPARLLLRCPSAFSRGLGFIGNLCLWALARRAYYFGMGVHESPPPPSCLLFPHPSHLLLRYERAPVSVEGPLCSPPGRLLSRSGSGGSPPLLPLTHFTRESAPPSSVSSGLSFCLLSQATGPPLLPIKALTSNIGGSLAAQLPPSFLFCGEVALRYGV